jgi:hypothetical protein
MRVRQNSAGSIGVALLDSEICETTWADRTFDRAGLLNPHARNRPYELLPSTTDQHLGSDAQLAVRGFVLGQPRLDLLTYPAVRRM